MFINQLVNKLVTKKNRILCASESNKLSVSEVNVSLNLLGATIKMWDTLSLCFRLIASIVFDLSCSQYLNIFIYFCVGLNIDIGCWEGSITPNVLVNNIVVLLDFVSDFISDSFVDISLKKVNLLI